jgi:tight adherence protein C
MEVELLGLNLIDIITILAGVAALITCVVVWQAATASKPMGKRLKNLEERRESLKAGIVTTKRRQSTVKKGSNLGGLADIAKRFRGMQSEQTQKIKVKLFQAGYRNQDALILFTVSKVILPVLFLVLAIMVVYGMQMLPGNPMGQTFSLIGATAFGFYLPNLMVQNTATKRQQSIQKALPDALDLMVIAAEAGLTLDASLTRVAREMGRQSEELADEFGLTAVELGFLGDRRDALTNLTDRVPLKSVRSVVATLIQTEKYGTPLAHSLRVLSQEFRNERMMKAEEKAARLPAIMTIPLIMFILPMLFIILLGPAACSIADNVIGRF